MSDNEDPNSRRPARPSTPPFRGPAGPAGRSPLTPPTGGNKPVPTQPFAPPGASRPATPAAGSRRRPTPTPPVSTQRREEPTGASGSAYGSPPPASVAATLKSISEFTIVNTPDTAAPPAQAVSSPTLDGGLSPHLAVGSVTEASSQHQGRTSYEPPMATEAEFDYGLDDSVSVVDSLGVNQESREGSRADASGLSEAEGQQADGQQMEVEASRVPMFDSMEVLAADHLDDIARQLRAGELTVPHIDASAGTPAVLAAVLAALLAPSR